jgi:hypothetical protein
VFPSWLATKGDPFGLAVFRVAGALRAFVANPRPVAIALGRVWQKVRNVAPNAGNRGAASLNPGANVSNSVANEGNGAINLYRFTINLRNSAAAPLTDVVNESNTGPNGCSFTPSDGKVAGNEI